MKQLWKSFFALLLCVLLMASVLPTAAFAAGKIDTDRNIPLTISYKDGTKAIPNARFEIYKVAEVDEYAQMTLTSDFEPYKSSVSGMNDLNNIKDNAVWLAMASTLKGYVLLDKVTPAVKGSTNSSGELVFNELKAGLYLVIGYRTTLADWYTYSEVPFMVFLPGADNENNDWLYDVTVAPKFTKDYNPPDDPDDVTRKVIKVWDDSGFETIRPQSVTVKLLRDGSVYDTRILNKDNNWRYAWDNLERDHEWTVVEITPEGYAVKVSQQGIITTITNKYIVPVAGSEIIVQKRLTGDTPPSKAPFTFVLTAGNPAYPMPEGSIGGIKRITINGAGSIGFGKIDFSKAGTYVYTVYEENAGLNGYTYDTTVYTVTYTVTEEDGELSVERRITSNKAGEVDNVVFTNHYGNKLPQTGALWWPVPVLLLAGFAFVMAGVLRRRRSNG